MDRGADIISMSWGGLEDSQVLHDAITYAYNTGVLLVAAAGNDRWSISQYPAAYPEVIAVTATDQFDAPADFTNFGNWVELAAPGVAILSTYPGNRYVFLQGTSMAAPHVSGVGALIWSRFPAIARDQVRIQLRRSAVDLGDSGFDEFFGFGRINARNSVEQLLPDHDLQFLHWSVPRFANVGAQLQFNITVHNFGLQNESNVELQLLIDGAINQTVQFPFLQSGESAETSLTWSSPVEGTFNVTLNLTPVLHEVITENNGVTTLVHVRLENTIFVPADFPEISEAIEAAGTGFTIHVSSGEYLENLAFRKPLTIIGEDPATTLINGDGRTALLAFFTTNSTVSGFTIQNSDVAIHLFGLNDSIVSNNRLVNNTSGIILTYPCNNMLQNNNMSGNQKNFGVEGRSPSHFVNDVDNSNTVNGKPVYYWVNEKAKQVPADAGFVALVNSTGITVKDLDLATNHQGILLAYTNHSVVDNVKLTGNHVGVELWHSHNSTFTNVACLNNRFGIAVWQAHGTILSNLTISGSLNGVELWHSTQNTISHSNMNNNAFGILLFYCHKTVLTSNHASDGVGAFIFIDSTQNNVNNSAASDNAFGICLSGSGNTSGSSSGNFVADNRIESNVYGLIVESGSSNNTLMRNHVLSNNVGVILSSSRNNTVRENLVRDNSIGFKCTDDSNTLHHNNIINNQVPVFSDSSADNWDDGYPSGGNYWSDFTAPDIYSGPQQDESGADYICDDPYYIDDDNRDNYPLITPWTLLLGDVNDDQKVDIYDLIIAAATYHLELGDQDWNPLADVAPKWRIVDIFDIVTIAYHYGETLQG